MSHNNDTCSSLELLAEMRPGIKRANPALAEHLDVCVASGSAPLKLFRTVDEFFFPTNEKSLKADDITYHKLSKMEQFDGLTAMNCHNGQKKLVLSVVEFLAESLSKLLKKDPAKTQKDFVVVYAGASGLATVVAAKLFPDVSFVLFDPAPNTVSLIPKKELGAIHVVRNKSQGPASTGRVDLRNNRIVVFTDRAGWFDDAEASTLGSLVEKDGKTLLFISDVRADAEELDIARDMQNQQRWAVLTKSHAYMFKFRVPYRWDDVVQNIYKGAQEHMVSAAESAGVEVKFARAAKKEDGGMERKPSMLYLDGQMHIQLFPRVKTGELRLIGYPTLNKKTGKKTYDMRNYAIDEIEDKLALFNFLYRSHAKFFFGRHVSTFLGDATFPSYEVVAELAIACRCNTVNGKRLNVQEVGETLDVVNRTVESVIAGKETVAKCALASFKNEKNVRDAIAKKHLAKCRINCARAR